MSSCRFFLPQKKRFCSQRRIEGNDFCGVHAERQEERIQCPIDSSHTIFTRDERAHVHKCNATKALKELQTQPYYKKDVNKGSISSEDKSLVDSFRFFIRMNEGENDNDDDDDEIENKDEIEKTGDEKVKEKIMLKDSLGHQRERRGGYISRLFLKTSPVNIRLIVLRLVDMIPFAEDSFKDDLLVKCDLVAPNINKHVELSRAAGASIKSSLRQSIQEASIISQMFINGLLDTSETTFIDLGAGKANLSLALHLSVPLAKLLLVERSGGSGSRGAADTSFRRDDFRSFCRLKIDLADFDLVNMIKLGSVNGSVVGLGKHVCGSATDLSLRCLERSFIDSNVNTSEKPRQAFLKGVCIATCCHHRCTWEDYVGKAFFTDKLGGTAVEFEVLRLISSWALMGDDETCPDFPRITKDSCFDSESLNEWEQFSRSKRIQIGRAAKRIIDAGRIHFLENVLGLRARQVFYCEQSISPENCLIVAKVE